MRWKPTGHGAMEILLPKRGFVTGLSLAYRVGIVIPVRIA